MLREDLGDMAVFLAVVDERNFTRAAARLGVSQPAVSHAIRRLEASLGLKLLNRTSRHVSTTDIGEKVLAVLRPGFGQIEDRIEELQLLSDTPRGLVRITASKPAARAILMPVLSQIVTDYPELRFEVSLDGRLADLTEDRFDAGIRLQEHLAPDMISVPVGPALRLAAVATPGYFDRHGIPQHPRELATHACLALRFAPHAAPYDWEFEQAGEEIAIRAIGPFIFSESDICIEAARAGHGIAFVTEQEVSTDIEHGLLRPVLADWCPPFGGYHLYYSSRRQVTSGLRLLIDRLRYRD